MITTHLIKFFFDLLKVVKGRAVCSDSLANLSSTTNSAKSAAACADSLAYQTASTQNPTAVARTTHEQKNRTEASDE